MPADERSGPAKRRLLTFLVTFCAVFTSANSAANPSDPTVISGSVQFEVPNAGTLNVYNSPGAIINWNDFSIGVDEITRFIQESASSAVLNRVTGGNLSQIMGQLLSNGQVFLVNPAGILVGPSATIDAASFVASTLNLSDHDFLTNNFRFTGDANAGSILNAGVIRAGTDGNILLIAPEITNEGTISSDGGNVTLAAGESMLLTTLDNPEIQFEVQSPDNAVLNLGDIRSAGGAIDIFAATISNSGSISADSVGIDAAGNVRLLAGGDIELGAGSTVSADGGSGGDVLIDNGTGTTWARGEITALGSDGNGGTITLIGTNIGLDRGSLTSASGATGGGAVYVGGSQEGQGPLPNAAAVVILPDAVVAANALENGDGGTVIAYSDVTTKIWGSLQAEGGATGGDGGFVETSGRNDLVLDGSISTNAPAGTDGTWLIDPTAIEIVAGNGVTGFDEVYDLTSDTQMFDPTAGSSGTVMLGVDQITSEFNNNNNVLVRTGTGGAGTGDITLSTDLQFDSSDEAKKVTFNSFRDIIINGEIRHYADTDNSLVQGLELFAGRDIRINSALRSRANWLIDMRAGRDIFLDAAIINEDLYDFTADFGDITVKLLPDTDMADMFTGRIFLNADILLETACGTAGCGVINARNFNGTVVEFNGATAATIQANQVYLDALELPAGTTGTLTVEAFDDFIQIDDHLTLVDGTIDFVGDVQRIQQVNLFGGSLVSSGMTRSTIETRGGTIDDTTRDLVLDNVIWQTTSGTVNWLAGDIELKNGATVALADCGECTVTWNITAANEAEDNILTLRRATGDMSMMEFVVGQNMSFGGSNTLNLDLGAGARLQLDGINMRVPFGTVNFRKGILELLNGSLVQVAMNGTFNFEEDMAGTPEIRGTNVMTESFDNEGSTNIATNLALTDVAFQNDPNSIGSGTIMTKGLGSGAGPTITLTDAAINNNRDFTTDFDGDFTIADGGGSNAFNNQANGKLTVGTDGPLTSTIAVPFINSSGGLVTVQSDHTLVLSGGGQGGGTFDVAGPSGILRFETVAYDLFGSTLDVGGSGNRIRFRNITVSNTSGMVTNFTGIIDAGMPSDNLVEFENSTFGTGATEQFNFSLRFTPIAGTMMSPNVINVNADILQRGLNVQDNVIINVNGGKLENEARMFGMAFTDSLTVLPASSVINVNGGTFVHGGFINNPSGDSDIDGIINVNGGTLSSTNGGLDIRSTGALNLLSGSILNVGDINNAGTVTLTSGTVDIGKDVAFGGAGYITNNAGSLFELAGDLATFKINGMYIDPAATFRKSSAGTTNLQMIQQMYNDGTVELQSGTLNLSLLETCDNCFATIDSVYYQGNGSAITRLSNNATLATMAGMDPVTMAALTGDMILEFGAVEGVGSLATGPNRLYVNRILPDADNMSTDALTLTAGDMDYFTMNLRGTDSVTLDVPDGSTVTAESRDGSVAGSLNLSGGTLSTTGNNVTVNVRNQTTLGQVDGPDVNLDGFNLLTNGQITWSGGDVNLLNGASITVDADGGAQDLLIFNDEADNLRTMTGSAGSFLRITSGDAMRTRNGQSVTFAGLDFINEGNVSVAVGGGSFITVDSGSSSNANFDLTSGTFRILNGTYTLTDTTMPTGVRGSFGDMLVVNSTLTLAGTNTIDRPVTFTDSVLISPTMAADPFQAFTGGFTVGTNGSLDFQAKVSADLVNVQSGATMTLNAGDLNLTGAGFGNQLVTTATSFLEINPGTTLTLGLPSSIGGTVNLQGGTFVENNNQLFIDTTGSFIFTSGAYQSAMGVTTGGIFNSGTFDIQGNLAVDTYSFTSDGTFSKSVGGGNATVTMANGAFDNQGVFNVSSGTVTLASGNSTTVYNQTAAGASTTLSSGIITQGDFRANMGTVNGQGTIDANADLGTGALGHIEIASLNPNGTLTITADDYVDINMINDMGGAGTIGVTGAADVTVGAASFNRTTALTSTGGQVKGNDLAVVGGNGLTITGVALAGDMGPNVNLDLSNGTLFLNLSGNQAQVGNLMWSNGAVTNQSMTRLTMNVAGISTITGMAAKSLSNILLNNTGTLTKTNGGTISIVSNGRIENTGSVSFQGAPTLHTVSGSGTEEFHNKMGGTVTFNGDVTFSNAIFRNDGTANFNNGVVNLPNPVLNGMVNLSMSSFNLSGATIGGTLSTSNNTSLNLLAGTVDVSGLNITDDGSGMLVLNGGNLVASGGGTFALPVTFQSGSVSGGGALTFSGGIVVPMGGTVALDGSITTSNLTVNSGGTLNLNSGSLAITPMGSTNLVGGSNLNIASGASFTPGPTLGVSGTLALNGNGLNLAGTTVTVQNTGILDLSGATATVNALGINNLGALKVVGATLNVTNFNQTAGFTDVTNGTMTSPNPLLFNGGTLRGNNGNLSTVNMVSGLLSVGQSPGTLNFTNLTLGGASTTLFELAGYTAGSQYDVINVTNNLDIQPGATIQVTTLGGFSPFVGVPFNAMSFGTLGAGTDFTTQNAAFLVSRVFGTNQMQLVPGGTTGTTTTTPSVQTQILILADNSGPGGTELSGQGAQETPSGEEGDSVLEDDGAFQDQLLLCE